MKIGIVSQSYYPRYGGVTEHVHALALELRRRGHEVTVLTSRFRKGETGETRGVRRIGYNILIPFNRAFVDFTIGWGLKGQLKQGAIDLQFRMVDRHRIRAQFYKQTRSGDVVLNQQVRFGDDVYIVNDRVVSKMDLRKFDLVYTYSFLRREKIELSAGLGIHLLQAEGTLDAPARFVSENLDVAGPYATLAFDGTWRFTKRFSLNAQATYPKGHVDDVRGSYKAWNADVQFRARPNFTLSAGYSATRFFLDSSDPTDSGLFRFDYKGPQAFIRVSL